jgi:subtilisin family serine protease
MLKTFTLVLASSIGLAHAVEVHDFRLDLGGELRDLRAEKSLDLRSGASSLALVQFNQTIMQSDLDAISAAGARAVQYLHPHTYVLWADGAALSGLESRANVRALGALRVQDKLVLAEPSATRFHVLHVRAAELGSEEFEAAGFSELQSAVIDQHFAQSLLERTGGELESLAELGGIFAIASVPSDGGLRNELSNQLYANNVDQASNPPVPLAGYLSWLNGRSVSGDGVLIANVDGGVAETHPDLVNRMRACTGTTCSTTQSTHGSHTAGIMAADGSSGVNNAQGFRRGLGVAPGAKLIEQVYSPFFQQAGGMLLLMRDSYNNGAQLSGNSWGPAGSPRGYDQDTRQVDVGSRDTDPNTAGDQPLTFVLSIMNGNGGVSSQGTPDEAKNVITVGSSKVNSGAGALLEWRDLSANSGHGPALDGRTIPHLIAPGCSVDSTVTGTSYGFQCGTSMASPHVSGGVALFAHAYKNRFSVFPSPAMSKLAMMVHTENMGGRLDADGVVMGNRPDSKQGFGRARLDRVLDSMNISQFVDQTHVFEATGESRSYRFKRANNTQPVQVMMSFTDAPGAGLGGSTPAWVNDLDLVVVAAGNEYRGNVFGADNFSSTGGGADTRNNTELVQLNSSPITGEFEVRVLATGINGDALPNTGDATQQDFALICVNCLPATEAGAILLDGFE